MSAEPSPTRNTDGNICTCSSPPRLRPGVALTTGLRMAWITATGRAAGCRRAGRTAQGKAMAGSFLMRPNPRLDESGDVAAGQHAACADAAVTTAVFYGRSSNRPMMNDERGNQGGTMLPV
ncbi:hypothetical protein MY4824_002647 [Beauveria thailandica]